MRNAELRTALEPLADESLTRVNVQQMSTPEENEYLSSMLAWERAPILPVRDWYDPPLEIPHPHSLGDDQLQHYLWYTIYKLFEYRIVLDFTDHLSDRQLYTLIYRDILPAAEKKIEASSHYLHWDCALTHENPEVWLRHYASGEDRAAWAGETGEALPVFEAPPYPRDLPRAPL